MRYCYFPRGAFMSLTKAMLLKSPQFMADQIRNTELMKNSAPRKFITVL